MRNAYQTILQKGKSAHTKLRKLPNSHTELGYFIFLLTTKEAKLNFLAESLSEDSREEKYITDFYDEILNLYDTSRIRLEYTKAIGASRRFQGLMDLAIEAKKPIFKLTPADGAIGSQAKAVQTAYKEYEGLVDTMLQRIEESEDTQ